MYINKSTSAAVEKEMSTGDANLRFEEYIAGWLKRDPTEAISNRRRRHPEWQDEWLEYNVRFGWISDSPNGWYLRGIARRIATDDLDEFGLFLQMYVRQAILHHRANEDYQNEFTDTWPLLIALAIGDQLAIDRYLEIATYPLSKGHPDVRTIYNGVHALLRGDNAAASELIAVKLSSITKKPLWLTGIVESLQGIVDRNASAFAKGIAAHLKGFPRRSYFPLERSLSLEAHGLFRLAERISNRLGSEVEIDRDPPWDVEFHQWSAAWTPALSVAHFGACPRSLAAAFVTLERPPWID